MPARSPIMPTHNQCLSQVQLHGGVYELCYSSTSILELDVGVSSVTVLL